MNDYQYRKTLAEIINGVTAHVAQAPVIEEPEDEEHKAFLKLQGYKPSQVDTYWIKYPNKYTGGAK
jgi:hypothetical protein